MPYRPHKLETQESLTKLQIRTLKKYARQRYLTSDRPKYCWVCNHQDFQVAHIKAVESFDGSKPLLINALANLMALCKICHAEYDNQDLPKCRVKTIVSKIGIRYLENMSGQKVFLHSCNSPGGDVAFCAKDDSDNKIYSEGRIGRQGSKNYKGGDIIALEDYEIMGV